MAVGRWAHAVLLLACACVPCGANTDSHSSPATTTNDLIPEPAKGWPEYCKRNNLWRPTAKEQTDVCGTAKDKSACEHMTNGCAWDDHASSCASAGCAKVKDQPGCDAKTQCRWNGGSHICENMPLVPNCDAMTEHDCITNRAHGCVYVDHVGCQSCASMTNLTSCLTVTECEWVSSMKCLPDHSDHTDCSKQVEADCKTAHACDWIAANSTCGAKDCSQYSTSTDCTTEHCLWKEGDCGPGKLDCSLHSHQASCKLLEAECTYYDTSKCHEPRCETAASSRSCLLMQGCEWDATKHICNNKAETSACKAAAVKADCDAEASKGCKWVDMGCHTKEPEFFSVCTGLNQTSCSDGCKWEESDSACKTSECDHYATEPECKLNHACSWNTDQHKCTAEEEHAGSHEHAEHPPPYNILVIFVIGALGAFFRHNFSDSPIPYTVILFVAGAVFDGLAKYAISGLQKYVDLADIDPHLLFYIFLPVLIFESAFAVDWFVFKQVLGHCLLLAGPGICVATFLTALIAKYAFWNYNWSWEAALLFGVTLSATDPVAVVALLKELGASPQISTLIEGESLLNDGTAIVIFTVLHQAVAGCSGHIEDEWYMVFLNLIRVAVGGPVLGWVTGAVAVDCLNRVFNDPLIEITTTLVTAYVTFFVAEAYCKVSGVLALVVCGIYMSHRKQCISPEVHHTLHEFWEMAVYLGNTLIFTMAGMIVMGRALDHFQIEDLFFLIITYVSINAVRFFVVKTFSIVYNNFAYKLDAGNMILVAWGGLRGAVGLALALIIAGDSRLQMRDESDPRTILRYKLVFFVAGIVVLTLLVNGVTTGMVVKRYKLDQVSDTKKRMMKENFRRLKEGGMDQLEDLKTESALYDVNWLAAKKWVFEDMHDPYNQDEDVFGEGDQHAEAVMHYFKIMHSSVWDQNEEGLLDGDAVRFLLAEINEREKLAKKKEKDTLYQPPLAAGDSVYAPEPASPIPGSPGPREVSTGERTQVDVQYKDTGRTIVLHMDPAATVLRLKQKVYNEENIPINQQKLTHTAQQNRKLEDNESIASLTDYTNGVVSVSLDRLNPDEDILLNAQILEQFWVVEEGWFGNLERVWDKVIGVMRRQSAQERKWTFGFNVAMALVIAHDAVLAKIDNIADPGEANKLKTHAKQVKREVLSQLVQFASQASQTSIAMKTTLAARTVLNHARRKVWEWQKEGLIEDKEAEVLVSHVEKKMKNLTKVDKKMKPCEQAYILSQMEWYQKASSDVKEVLKSRGKAVRFNRGDLLIRKGEEHNMILLITAGSARVHVSRRFDYVGPGYAAGLLSALTSTTKYCDIYAETELLALVFKAETVLQMMAKKGNEAFAQALWRSAGVDLAYKLLRGKEPYSKWAPREVRKFVNKGRLLELPKYRPDDKKVPLSHGCYHVLISGHARDATNQSKDAKISDLELIEAPCMLPVDSHEAYLQPFQWKIASDEQEDGSQAFGVQQGEMREDEVHVLVVEDPSSASARARKYWEKIYKKIRSIKTTAALRGANVKGALEEAFSGTIPDAAPAHPLKAYPSQGYYEQPHANAGGDHLSSPLLTNAHYG